MGQNSLHPHSHWARSQASAPSRTPHPSSCQPGRVRSGCPPGWTGDSRGPLPAAADKVQKCWLELGAAWWSVGVLCRGVADPIRSSICTTLPTLGDTPGALHPAAWMVLRIRGSVHGPQLGEVTASPQSQELFPGLRREDTPFLKLCSTGRCLLLSQASLSSPLLMACRGSGRRASFAQNITSLNQGFALDSNFVIFFCGVNT